MKHALLVRHNTRSLHILGVHIAPRVLSHKRCVHFSYYSTRENRKEVPSWLGLRCLSVLVLMQTISTLKVQLDAASYVADISLAHAKLFRKILQ